MPIQQISTSNTFAQWLTATQALIQNQNYYEENLDIVVDTANVVNNIYLSSVVSTYNNTVNVYLDTSNVYLNTTTVYSNTVNVYLNTTSVYSNTVNVYNDIQSYVAVAYDSANNASNVAQQAYDTANLALIAANSATSNIFAVLAYQRANDAYDLASSANVHAQAAFDRANISFSTITVPGQSNIAASSIDSSLNFVAGNNIVITTNVVSNTITIESTGGGGGGSLGGAQSIFALANTLILRDSFADGYANNFYANNFYSTSDVRLKEDIRTIENAVNTVIELRGVRFKWKGSSVDQLGVIAQEVENILPEVVTGEQSKSVNYAVIVSVLIEAIKELNERIAVLEKK